MSDSTALLFSASNLIIATFVHSLSFCFSPTRIKELKEKNRGFFRANTLKYKQFSVDIQVKHHNKYIRLYLYIEIQSDVEVL